MVLDAEITRAELSTFSDALHWSDNGSIAVNTCGQLTILNSKYVKGHVKYANQLFDIFKVDLEELPKNELFASEPTDEVGTTLFSSTDVSITKMRWSPLTSNKNSYQDSYLGILTNRRSVIILKNGKVLHDLTTTDSFDTQAKLDEHLVHSIGWLKNDDGSVSFITGLASGQVRFYTIKNHQIINEDTVCVSKNKITDIKGIDNGLIAISSQNEIYLLKNGSVTLLKETDRFSIYDIYVHNQSLFYATCNNLTRISLSSKDHKSIKTGILSTTKIIPSGEELILVSDTKTTKLDQSLNIMIDDILEPILKKRLNKWNSDFDDFHTKNYTLKVFGVDLNFNGSSLAVLYEIQNKQGFRYKISSENIFKIAFMELSNNFKNFGSTFAVYQGFKLTGNLYTFEVQADELLESDIEKDDCLKSMVLKNPIIIKAQTENLIKGNQDDIIRKKFAELVVKYVEINNIYLNDEIDQAVFNNLLILAEKPPKKTPKEITLSTGSFKQSFNFVENTDIETLKSTSGHTWPRCSLTFLPIITPFVKVDPVTERRIIDIERDINDYGPFTKTLLSLNEICIYSGSHFIRK